MKRMLFVILLLSLAFSIFGAHDFTVNNETTLDVSVGDELILDFAYESEGNTAQLSFSISGSPMDIPFIDQLNADLADGGIFDTTETDGMFNMSFNLPIQVPLGLSLVLTVTDDEVEDSVTLHFVDLESSYSVGGSVKGPGIFGAETPVFPAGILVLYNLGFDDLDNFDFANLLDGHYLIFGVTSLLGNYTVTVPDEIENVNCTVYPYSQLNGEANIVAPQPQMVTVNGVMTDIDFLYIESDGSVIGTITNSLGDPVSEVAVNVTGDNSLLNFDTTEEDGNYAIALMNGTYTLYAVAEGYLPFTQEFEINDNDTRLDITLSSVEGAWTISGVITNDQAEPVANAVINVSGEGSIINPAMSNENGEYSVTADNGTYTISVIVLGYEAYSQEFTVADEDITLNITLATVANEENVVDIEALTLNTYPNPFKNELTIDLKTDKRNAVEKVTIYNLKGQVVKNFTNESKKIIWNGKDNNNNNVANGVYFLKVKSNNNQITKKVVMMK